MLVYGIKILQSKEIEVGQEKLHARHFGLLSGVWPWV